MFAAGVMNNFAVTVVAFALLFGPVAGSVAVAAGVPVGGVLPGSPAGGAGLERGDVVTSVEGVAVDGPDELETALAAAESRTVEVGLRDGTTATIERSVVVTGAAGQAPVGVNETIRSVNGTSVFTEGTFREAVTDRPVVRLGTTAGDVTTPVGAFTTPRADEAFAAAGAPVGEPVVVTTFDGERVVDNDDLSAVLADTTAGDEVTVVGYVDGERRTWTVTLGADPSGDGSGFLGVGIQPGYAGMSLDDFGTDIYPAGAFLGLLGGGEGDAFVDAGPIRRAYIALTLPFASLTIPGLGYNFAGFVGPVTNFYTATGPLAVLGTGGVLLLANVLFWTAWINLIIGQFNCIPAYPLDGGHLLRTSTEAVVSRLPVSDGRSITSAVTTTLTIVMIGGVLLMVFGPRLFG
jgi:membrane-associated protease RseP (regulator of RpoE activity)